MSRRLRPQFSLATLGIGVLVFGVGVWLVREHFYPPMAEALHVSRVMSEFPDRFRVARGKPNLAWPFDVTTSPVVGEQGRLGWRMTKTQPVTAVQVRGDVSALDDALFSPFTQVQVVHIGADNGRWSGNGMLGEHRWRTSDSSFPLPTARSDRPYAEPHPLVPLVNKRQLLDLCSQGSIVSLALHDVEVTQEHLLRLVENKNLLHLRIVNGKIDDSDLEIITRMTQLQTLDLGGNQFKGRGWLSTLDRMTALKTLDVRHCPVTDSYLEPIARLPSLVSLNLGKTQVRDRGMMKVAESATIESLEIYDTFVSAASTSSIIAMPALNKVNIIGANFNEFEVEELLESGWYLEIQCILSPTRLYQRELKRRELLEGEQLEKVRQHSTVGTLGGVWLRGAPSAFGV